MTTKDDYQCTNVETPNCCMEEKIINDVTCTNSVEFNCKRDKSTNVETPNCYMEEKIINDVTCTNSVEFNCKRDKSTKNDGYGPKGVVCDRKPTQNCYNIPRK